MHKKFEHKHIEGKWQAKWAEEGVYRTDDSSDKPKTFVLDMFPYPSGEGLHVGHPKGYIATDIYSRFKRMSGHEVLHPMGWDAFGLPAENFAIKNKVHPRVAVDTNVARFKEQLSVLGFDYDWECEINTTDPEFYKWTQWIFIQLYKQGLAYQSHEPINWCPGCQTGLANEDLEADGTCERCDSVVEKRPMRQWVLNIRAYADRMLEDLDTLEWPEHIKEAQRNWIGRSEGAEIDFEINLPREKSKALIMHGFAGDPSKGWKPWLQVELEKRGYEVRNPKLPNFSSPNYDEVMEFLRLQTADFTENDMLVGHSLGCHFAMKLAEEKAFDKVMCVAPSFSLCDLPYDVWRKNLADYDVQSAIDIIEKYPIDETKVKVRNKLAIFGETDEGVPCSNTKKLDDSWTTVIIPAIGHMSEEVEIPQIIQSAIDSVTVFTTRPDTLYGATYLVLAPEHPLMAQFRGPTPKYTLENADEVETYIAAAANKKEMDRLDDTKEKTGVKLEGITATNPANGEEIPVYIADYVLASYGTGAIMAVPAHDQRDHEFAQKYDIEIRPVILDIKNDRQADSAVRRSVYALLKNTNNEYLIQHYEKPNYFWLPGGGVDDGEKDEEALLREIKEETVFTNVTIGKKVHEHLYDYTDSDRYDGRCHTIIYEVEIDDDTRVEAALEHEELKDGITEHWVTADTVDTVVSGSDSTRIEILVPIIKQQVPLFTSYGVLGNSGEFDGLHSEEAKVAITEKVGGRMTRTYKIKDWVFSRQRYWGEPFPVIHGDNGEVYMVAEEQLPVVLPEVEHYEPAGDGQSPLANIDEWVNVTGYLTDEGDFMVADAAPAGKQLLTGKRETNTMPQWAGSSWYYLRYIDPNNNKALIDPTKEQDWMPVDVYVGGDHAVRHLIYARFWHKFLYDQGVVSTLEPFQRLEFLGFILAEDGRKMSKRWGNVINPDDIVKLVGADTLRVYEMFMGPFENTIAWSQDGLAGARRFLERVNGLSEHVTETGAEETTRQLHKTIKKVAADIEDFKFNTAVSAMMVFVNTAEKAGLTQSDYQSFLQILAPFAPHLSEELWHQTGQAGSIHTQAFPTYDEALTVDTEVTIGVQINGKVRGDITIAPDAPETEALQAAHEHAQIARYLDDATVRKVIYKPGKILNIVVG